jgi:hypothetical protein
LLSGGQLSPFFDEMQTTSLSFWVVCHQLSATVHRCESQIMSATYIDITAYRLTVTFHDAQFAFDCRKELLAALGEHLNVHGLAQ